MRTGSSTDVTAISLSPAGISDQALIGGSSRSPRGETASVSATEAGVTTLTQGRALPHQVLYKKSMQALDLLLQSFLSENKSMDEMCFLLQVRAGGARGAELAALAAQLDPGLGLSKVHSGWSLLYGGGTGWPLCPTPLTQGLQGLSSHKGSCRRFRRVKDSARIR